MKKYTSSIYKYILLLGAVTSLTTCAEYDLESDQDEKPIRLVAGREYDPTRAVVTTDLQGPVFDAGETVNVWISGKSDDNPTTTEHPGLWPIGDQPTRYTTSAAVNGKNTLLLPNSSPQPYYFTGSNSMAHIFAAYPANDDVNVTPAMTTFTVKYDQTTERAYKNSDLMFATLDHDKTAGAISLPFKHKMTKLIVTAVADGDVTIDDVITIGSIQRSVDIDVEKGDFAYSAEAPTTIPLSDENADDYTKRKITILNGGAAVFPPQHLESAVEFITVTGKKKEGNTWTNQTAKFNIIGKTFKEGRVYKINLHIGTTDFTPHPTTGDPHVSSITGWSEEYDELTVTPSGGYSSVNIADVDGHVTAETSTSGAYDEDGYYVYSTDAQRSPVPCCPKPTVTYGDEEILMTEGVDFRYVYVDNVNAGNNAQVMVVGIGSYAGLAALKPFSIKRAKGKISFPENSDKTGDNAVTFNPDENIGFVSAINTGDGPVTYEVIKDGDDETTTCASVDRKSTRLNSSH